MSASQRLVFDGCAPTIEQSSKVCGKRLPALNAGVDTGKGRLQQRGQSSGGCVENYIGGVLQPVCHLAEKRRGVIWGRQEAVQAAERARPRPRSAGYGQALEGGRVHARVRPLVDHGRWCLLAKVEPTDGRAVAPAPVRDPDRTGRGVIHACTGPIGRRLERSRRARVAVLDQKRSRPPRWDADGTGRGAVSRRRGRWSALGCD